MKYSFVFAILLLLAAASSGDSYAQNSAVTPKPDLPGLEVLPLPDKWPQFPDSLVLAPYNGLKLEGGSGSISGNFNGSTANGIISGSITRGKSSSDGFTLGERKYFIRNSGTEYVGIDVKNDHTLLLGQKAVRRALPR